MKKIDSMQFWRDQLVNRSKSTRDVYTLYLRKFCEYSGKGPDELIELQRKAFLSEDDPRENHVVETEVRRWLAELQKTKCPATCRAALTAVKCFFNLNLHPLRLNRMDRPEGDSVGSRIPEKEEVIRIADAAKWKYRAGVMFLKDSGLRISDVVRVRWEDMEDLGDGFWHFEIVTQKRKVASCSFLGRETTRLLEQFPTKKGRIFRTVAQTFNDKINALIKTAGIERVSGHGLRKYFKAQMEHARIPEQHILFMMGKKNSVYSEKRRSQLFEDYRKGYPELSLYAEKSQMEELERLKSRIHELEETRYKEDQLLARMESLIRLPGAREMYEDITRTAEDKLHAILKKHESL